ncbi:hypothetical protein [Rhodopirellula sallentina]|uniref:hypothetical protein n=1 Tax=Rhodopirellula sallentina TaxID=1263869 RepID=UPI001181C64A|nr:hypothetical protein [Rhodopirellula sallentina]
MKKQTQRYRKTSNRERTLRLEQLESRALLSADFAALADVSPSASAERFDGLRVSADRPMDVSAPERMPNAAADHDAMLQVADKIAGAVGERARERDNNGGLLTPWIVRPEQVTGPAIERPLMAVSKEVAIDAWEVTRHEHLNNGNVDKEDFARDFYDRLVHERTQIFQREKPERDQDVERDIKIELIPIRTEQPPAIWVVVVNDPQRDAGQRDPGVRDVVRADVLNSGRGGEYGDDLDVTMDESDLDGVISTIANDEGRTSGTVSVVDFPSDYSPAFKVGLSVLDDAQDTKDQLDFALEGEGGLIEIDSSEHANRSSEKSADDEDDAWKIESETIDRISANARAEHSAVPSDGSTDRASENAADRLALDASGDGGLIAIGHVVLPRALQLPLGEAVEVQLDPSMGHFRSFQLAAVPGHDVRAVHRDRALTMGVEMRTVGEDGDTAVGPVSLAPVAYAGMLFVSGVVLTVELRGRKSATTEDSEEPQLS